MAIEHFMGCSIAKALPGRVVDLNHPGRLVAAETDYDRFLHSFPLLATYLANLLITRMAVLVG